ncbi:conserved hypothetical protein [Streptomyces sviceus ATCC 29083]|uniref:Uncharacterized protein n=1 Tax=Streptomyces sviceus (strain ATCC 29083 / DSM 924 / JCM 4929 / NBRC 13980 / NCIMB 11184 / NRRL 5439 / UC 5370) TaxID=463191 RepID=B5HVZ7_STRX2|nr:conserved hypothetical protein [Streptomyces sviceus ATCC 29083]
MHRDPGQRRFFGDLTPACVGENVPGFFTNDPRGFDAAGPAATDGAGVTGDRSTLQVMPP